MVAVKVLLIPARALLTVDEVALPTKGSRLTASSLTLTFFAEGRVRAAGRARAVEVMVDRLGPAVGSTTPSAGLSVVARLLRVVLRAMIGRPVTVDVVFPPATFGLSPLVTLTASLLVNSPSAARFRTPASCFVPAIRLVPAVGCFALTSPFPAVAVETGFLTTTVDADEVVRLMLGLTGALLALTPGLTTAVVRDRVVGAFSSVRVLRAGSARVRRACRVEVECPQVR